jgi:hypothetical protein
MSSLTRFEGYLLVDNRAGGGIPSAGIKRFEESATLTCAHCATGYVKNPQRVRPREFCRKCDRYICDGCGAAAAKPDYVHRSFAELADIVREGKFSIVGGSASNPILVPRGAIDNG